MVPRSRRKLGGRQCQTFEVLLEHIATYRCQQHIHGGVFDRLQNLSGPISGGVVENDIGVYRVLA